MARTSWRLYAATDATETGDSQSLAWPSPPRGGGERHPGAEPRHADHRVVLQPELPRLRNRYRFRAQRGVADDDPADAEQAEEQEDGGRQVLAEHRRQ